MRRQTLSSVWYDPPIIVRDDRFVIATQEDDDPEYALFEMKNHAPFDGCWHQNAFWLLLANGPYQDAWGKAYAIHEMWVINFHRDGLKTKYPDEIPEMIRIALTGGSENRVGPFSNPKIHTDPNDWSDELPIPFWDVIKEFYPDFTWKCDGCGERQTEIPDTYDPAQVGKRGDGGFGIHYTSAQCLECGEIFNAKARIHDIQRMFFDLCDENERYQEAPESEEQEVARLIHEAIISESGQARDWWPDEEDAQHMGVIRGELGKKGWLNDAEVV